MSVRTIPWDHGEGEVQSLGGMLGPARFRLADGTIISPFHVAPRTEHPAAAALPGIPRRPRGEWPCVPFGVGREGPLAGAWAGTAQTMPDGHLPHGHGANADWTFGEGLSLGIASPAESPVVRPGREIRPDPDAPALGTALSVHVRSVAMLPIGLHPTFRIPEEGVGIETERGGMTFPAAVHSDHA